MNLHVVLIYRGFRIPSLYPGVTWTQSAIVAASAGVAEEVVRPKERLHERATLTVNVITDNIAGHSPKAVGAFASDHLIFQRAAPLRILADRRTNTLGESCPFCI